MPQPVAIVTAASRGIGAGIARALAARDYALVLMSRSSEIAALAAELGAIPFEGDVTQVSDLAAVVELAQQRFERIDVVVNNTGHPPKGDLLALSDSDWHAGLDLVLLNVARMARIVTPVMVAAGGGSIINISTMAALEPSLDYPISGTLRAGLAGYTKLYADRYGPDGIRMNNVLPGFADNFPLADAVRTTIPLQRQATMAELGQTVAFLASPEAGYITGQNIRVDGGVGRSW